jgi:hypothetical protein
MMGEGFPEVSQANGMGDGYVGTPVLLHVSLHKTATTWLQFQMLGPKSGRELAYCDAKEILHGTFIQPGWGEFKVADALMRLAPHLAQAEAGGLPLVLSAEALAGFPFHHKFAREITAQRLRRTFPRAKILITVREQRAIIASMYGEYIKLGYTSRIEDFIAPHPQDGRFEPILDRTFYEYDKLFDLYAGLFGAENVLIAPMEWLTRDIDGAVARISALLGCALSPPDPSLAALPQNEAWTDIFRSLLRRLNHFASQDSRWMRRDRRGPLVRRLQPTSLAHRMHRLSLRLGATNSGAREKAVVAAVIKDAYAESNARFAARSGFALRSLGYPVAG